MVLLAGTAANAAADDAAASDNSCTTAPLTQPFADWGDQNDYYLAPNGDFESGLDGWSLSGDAGLIADPEPWSVTDSNESQSLELGAGSSATSPSTCLDVDDPTMRFFAVNRGDPASVLDVSVSVDTPVGPLVLPLATITSDGTWEPTPTIFVGVNLLAALQSTSAQFIFTPAGDGDWEIDDLYVDPWGRT